MENILLERKNENTHLWWITKSNKIQTAYKKTKKFTPTEHKLAVIINPQIQKFILNHSKTTGQTTKTIEYTIRSILDEIGYEKNEKLIRWLAYILIKICLKIYYGIYVDKPIIQKLRHQMGNCPVVFLPTHRSYADFILMSLLCFNEDLAIPAIAAGTDFYNMRGIGAILRRTGAYYMRRTYNSDAIYWTTFKHYFNQLLIDGDLPLEFFIEGTRSRSGKSLIPKYGLILLIIKALLKRHIPDVIIVPITITYERLLEEKLFIYELLGVPKPKETTSGLIKSLKILNENYGNVYMKFNMPISGYDYFFVKQILPIERQQIDELNEQERQCLHKFVYNIIECQQKQTVVTCIHLMAIILTTTAPSMIDLDELKCRMFVIKNVFDTCGAIIEWNDDDNTSGDILRTLDCHKNFLKLNGNCVCFVKQMDVNIKTNALDQVTIEKILPYIWLQLYVNPVLHFVVEMALIVIILDKQQLNEDKLFDEFCFLRSVLAMEFVICLPIEHVIYKKAIENCLKLDLIKSNDGLYGLNGMNDVKLILNKSIDRFIYTYFMCCNILMEKIISMEYDEKLLIINIQKQIEYNLIINNLLFYSYGLNLETIKNCLIVLSSQDALLKINGLYQIVEEKLCFIRDKLKNYLTINPDTLRIKHKL